MRKRLMLSGAALGFLLLILDGKTALSGARQGLSLCFETVIPSMLPFLFLSSLFLSGSADIRGLDGIGRAFGMPQGCAHLLIPGLLGGYPAGAQCIGQLYRQNALSRQAAEHMLMFCCNAGPAFLFGILPHAFPDKRSLLLLWGIQLLSAAMIAVFSSPAPPAPPVGTVRRSSIAAAEAIDAVLHAMAVICGWILLFRVLIAFLTRWVLWLLPAEWYVLCVGMLELANGCSMLNQIPNPRLRFLICSVILSFGGCCVTMQTASVIEGLSIRAYLKGKLLQCTLCALLAASVLHFGWGVLPIVTAALPVFFYIFRSNQKRAGIPQNNPV